MKNRGLLFVVAFILNLYGASPFAAEVKIGILGDSHGQEDAVVTALHRMKKEGVSHLIVLGDIVPWNLKDPADLRPILDSIRKESGLPKSNIYFAIGNAEVDVLGEWTPKKDVMKREGKTIESLQAEVQAKTLKYGEMLEKYYSQNPFHTTASFKMFLEYGNLTHSSPDDYSFLDVGGKRIAFSHYNKRIVPTELLQPNDVEVKVTNPKTGEIKIVHKNFRMPHTEDAARLNQAFPAGADLAFYGDIHIGGYYWDHQANKLIVNPGVLNAKAKDVDEPQAYSIYNATRDEVTFWDAVQDKPLLNANLGEIQKEARRNCSVIFKKLANLKK